MGREEFDPRTRTTAESKQNSGSAWKNLKNGEGFKQSGGLQPFPLFVAVGAVGAVGGIGYGIYKLGEAILN